MFDKTFQIVTAPKDGTVGNAVEEPVSRRSPGVLHGLSNLVENAADFAKETITVTSEWTDQMVSIIIEDDGPGFAQNMLDSLGEPYLTSRPLSGRLRKRSTDHARLGLGFFIASTLLERSGAEIHIANRKSPAKGAVVHVVWDRETFEAIGYKGDSNFG